MAKSVTVEMTDKNHKWSVNLLRHRYINMPHAEQLFCAAIFEVAKREEERMSSENGCDGASPTA